MSSSGEPAGPAGIDAAVRARLAASLAHVLSRAAGRLDADLPDSESALERIRTRRQDPGVFARYYDLIFAVGANQLSTAARLLTEIADYTKRPAHFETVPYSEEALGDDYERFPRLVFSEFSGANPMARPSEDRTAASTRAVEEAIEIIKRVDPLISAEIDEMLVRVVLAEPSRHPAARRFGGVSSFLVWGASFANIEHYRTRWDMVQFLVHEITHHLLFGLALHAPLVSNPPDESYTSPLRPDPRPMDGIYHATFVCARLEEFNRKWIESGTLDGDDRERSEKAIPVNRRRVRDGVAVIREHGRLSDRAWQLLERASGERPVCT